MAETLEKNRALYEKHETEMEESKSTKQAFGEVIK